MKKFLSTALVVGMMTSMNLTPVLADVGVNVLPSLNNATNANVTVDTNNMNIQINAGQGGVGTLNWNSYNVGANSKVNYEFTAHNQTALNKVDAAGGLSQIFGEITSSGCYNCGYEATGKVILINPNGVLFGDGANVNLNSFTVSTFNGVYDEATNKLQLDKTGNSQYGIVVLNGAKIHGDKAVNFISDNVVIYNGSKISTNIAPNYDADGDKVFDTSYGKVKIVTADGVNFEYYNNGAVKSIDAIKLSNDTMMINLNGEILSGNIDIRNYSTAEGSEINLNGAVLKAVKAEKGNDGNIWLTAANKVIMEDANLNTVNYSDAAISKKGGNVLVTAGEKVSVASTNIKAIGNIDLNAQSTDIVVESSNINADKDINLNANNVASVQKESALQANNVNINGKYRAQVTGNSTVKAANDIKMAGDIVWISNSKLEAANELVADALTENYLLDGDTTSKIILDNADLIADKIKLNAKNSVSGTANLNNSKTYINAGTDINLNLANVGKIENGLVAKAGKDMTIETDGNLSVSSLISGNNMTLKANKILSGYGKTENYLKEDGDSANRAYIEVGGTFTSEPSFEVTESAEITPDGKFQKRHHIEYSDGLEKILLVNKRPYEAPPVVEPPIVNPEPATPDVNDDQASMLNKLPQQPQTITNIDAYTDGRTSFVDVFAAASQIEIEDDEE